MLVTHLFKAFLFACGLYAMPAIANTTSPEQQADKTIRQLYHSPGMKPTANLSTRIAAISQAFLGAPYALGALGEGPYARYDQNPLYRTDAFDCETYVDTVIALARAHDIIQFQQNIRHIRYKEGHVSFIDRNHFTCLDWNQNNQHQGYVKDITTTLRDADDHPVASMAHALIDKPSWYQHFPLSIIRIPQATPKEVARRLAELKQKGQQLPQTISAIPYIPLTALFDHAGHANKPLFNQIPNAAIIELIRPNWDMEKQIGTHLNVSHLGFAIWEKGILMFRHATSTQDHVVEVPLIDYLRETQKSPTIKGINIQVVTP
ncbi:MAG TPA: DUF1460 domain-containing protein [Legionella sp.]|nr:DUF1460 domain-containing protein [Legionella sp.]